MSRRAADGRGVAQLVADFGHELPPLVPPPARVKDSDPFTVTVGKHGRSGRAAGWAPVRAPVVAYRMTSEQVGGVWPLIAGDGLPSTGAQMGIDFLSGGAFHVDPIGWTLSGVAGVTNPNMMFFGAPGRGKSGTVKMFCLRMMAYSYRTLILGDVKDEYEPLCRALGVEPHAVGHGLPARINPLDFGPLGNEWCHLPRAEAQRRAAMVFSRWLLLIKGLVGSQHVLFGPTAETAVGQVIRDLTGYATGADAMAEITIPQVWQALNNPTEQLIVDCRYSSRQQFLDETRPMRDALGSLVKGHLSGLFDAATTVDVDWRAPIQSLSLSRLDPLGDEAVGVALTCLNSWGRAMTQVAEPGDLRIIIRDECWKQMRLGTDAVKSLDADLRLSRRDGCIQAVIAHKPSDMLTVGDAGSQAVAIAKDLMHLCATKVLLGQDDQIGDELSDLLGLTPMAQRIVTDWATAAKGRALWLIGSHVAKVQTVRTSIDVAVTDTNDAITAIIVAEVEQRDVVTNSQLAGGGVVMAGQGTSGAKVTIGVAALPVIAMSSVLMVVAGGGANATPTSGVCGGGGTAQTIGRVKLDAEQMGNAQTIVSVTAGRRLPSYAAVVAVATSYTEVSLHNQLTETDHDSEGLFQQRISIYSKPVADDPVKATNAFLDRLVQVTNWQRNPVGVDAQTVQISQYPQRYQPNAPLAQQIVGQFWPVAAAAAGPTPTDSPTAGSGSTASAIPAIGSGPAICAGGGGAIPGGGAVAGTIVGPSGNNVAGTTTIPAGFVISGSAKGYLAVTFALAQLGKPYVFAAAGPNAFDCSGLTMAAWAAAGVALPHLAAGQTSHGTAEPTDLSQAVGGDLVMIPGADGTAANPGHVGMVAGYVDDRDGRHLFIVQAPMTGVPVELTEATEWSGQITNVRHIA